MMIKLPPNKIADDRILWCYDCWKKPIGKTKEQIRRYKYENKNIKNY